MLNTLSSHSLPRRLKNISILSPGLKESIKFNIDFALTLQACGREELADKRFKLFMELVDHIPDELRIKIDPRGSNHKLLTGAK